MAGFRNRDTRTRALQIALIVIVAAGGLLWGLGGADLAELGDALGGYQWAWVVPGVGGLALAFVFRILRFQLLLEGEPPFRAALSIMAVGFLAITVVPFRMGELVRPYLLRRKHGIPLGRSAAAVVLERLLDLLGLLVALALVAVLVEVDRPLRIGGVDVIEAGRRIVATGVAVGMTGLAALAAVGPRRLARLAPASDVAPARWLARIVRLAVSFTAALVSLAQRPVRALATITLTIGSWAGHFLAVAAVMAGFDALTVGVDLVLLHWTATQAAILVVPTPGFLGSFEAGSLGALRLLGVEPEVARAFTVVLHAVFFGFIAVGGGAFLLREGWSFATLIGESRRTGRLREDPAGGPDASDEAPPA